MTFDIATSMGVAFGIAGKIPRATTIDFGRVGSQEARFAKAISKTRYLVDRYKPEVIYYEAAIGGKHANAFLIGLAACVTGAAAGQGVEPQKVTANAIRKHFLGRALDSRDFPSMKRRDAKGQIKAAVIARCRMLGWEPRNDDEADAMALWDFACAQTRAAQSVPAGGLFR